MTAQVFRRAWQLYVAHVFLFVIFIAEVSYTVDDVQQPDVQRGDAGRRFSRRAACRGGQGTAAQFQPTFLDILPLYILMLAIFPFILLGLRRRPALVLIPSFARLRGGADFCDLGAGLPGRACLVLQPARLAIPVRRGRRARLSRVAGRGRLAGELGKPASARRGGGDNRPHYHQAQLDDPRRVGQFPGAVPARAVAGQQEQPGPAAAPRRSSPPSCWSPSGCRRRRAF